MRKIKLCPKCKKPQLKNATNVSGWLAPSLYECLNCKYIGPLFIEVDSNEYERMQEEKFSKEALE